MADYNENEKRRVTRQNWKPGHFWTALRGLWTAVYAVIKVGIAALATVLLIAGVCTVVFVGVLADYLEGDILPQAGVQLEGFDLDRPSYVYYIDDSGNIQALQKLHADIDSEWATYDQIPEAMIHAAISIEDHRFYEHQGVDWFTTIKACISMFVGGDQFGGSSITQQLIKNMLLTQDTSADDVTVQRKVLEIFRATEFEKKYDKSVVLEWYLNYIFLGNRSQGVKAAAERYFGKEVEDLTPAECACIISITNNPTIFNPLGEKEIKFEGEVKTQAEWNKIRRENTLWTMRNYGYLTEEEYQAALEESENMVFKNGIDFNDRYSTCPKEACGNRGHKDTYVLEGSVYYCPVCKEATTIGEDSSQEVYSWFVDTVINDLSEDMILEAGLEINDETKELYRSLISKGGYHIYTTLNMDVQNSVDKIYTNLDEIPTTSSMQQLQSGICIIDNETGDIIAICGGVGEKTTHLGYNRANVDRLQPGSSIKPLTVYAPAFELGLITPATVVQDMPLYYTGYPADPDEYYSDWDLKPYPKNEDRQYDYSFNILKGVTSSINGIAVNTLHNMGLDTSFHFAKDKFRLNGLVESYTNSNGTVFTDIAYSPLGMGAPTLGVSVRDMAAAFATFSNKGVWREARTYTHVYNTDGELVMYNEQESEKILSEKTAAYINYCLNNAVNNGTGTAAKIDGQVVAGKTGTTDSKRDRWFCGYTSYYTAAIWCGYDQPEVINLTGSDRRNPACRLFQKVMAPVHKNLNKSELYDDATWEEVYICQDSGMVATQGCIDDIRGSRVVKAKVHPDDLNMYTQTCTKHVQVEYCPVCQAPANEYCKKFATIGQNTLTTTWLVSMTQEEVDAINLACKHGLDSSYKNDVYVYLVDHTGNPGVYFGIEGDKNVGLSYPFLVGSGHTQQMWQAYLDSMVQQPDPSPTVPSDPTEPTNP